MVQEWNLSDYLNIYNLSTSLRTLNPSDLLTLCIVICGDRGERVWIGGLFLSF